MSAPDMDVIKEIPGYKVILKAVLKSQIQQLVEQLASHTDEESVILTASVSDGTLSHLGSDSGKFFLDDHEDIKSQFLGFCLKRHHRKKVEQQKTTPPMGSSPWPSHMGQSPGPRPRLGPQNRQSFPRQGMPRHPMSMPTKNLRHEPYPISKPRRSGEGNVGILDASVASPSIKLEPDDSSQHSRNDSESSNDGNNQNNQQGLDNQVQGVNVPSSDSNTSDPQTSTSDIDPNVKVKVEAISEADMELEITGVELGNNSDALRSPNTSMGYDASQVLGAMGSMGDMQAQPDYNESYGGTTGKPALKVKGMKPIIREHYDVMKAMLLGTFKVKVKQRSRAQKTAVIQFWRKKDFLAMEGDVLTYKGIPVLIKEDINPFPYRF